jgi:hypothetical protein
MAEWRWVKRGGVGRGGWRLGGGGRWVGPPDWTDESYYLFIIARRCFAHSNSRRRRGQANLKLSINHEGLHRGAQLQFVFSNIAWRSERFGGRQRLQAPTSVRLRLKLLAIWSCEQEPRARARLVE